MLFHALCTPIPVWAAIMILGSSRTSSFGFEAISQSSLSMQSLCWNLFPGLFFDLYCELRTSLILGQSSLQSKPGASSAIMRALRLILPSFDTSPWLDYQPREDVSPNFTFTGHMLYDVTECNELDSRVHHLDCWVTGYKLALPIGSRNSIPGGLGP